MKDATRGKWGDLVSGDSARHRTGRRREADQKVLQFQAPWKLEAMLPTRWLSGRFAVAGMSI
jgi:hypothetical protein